ncbi:MAG: DUF1207 domain-containing protein [Gemmatimonadales bacterium]|nr:DUF1207 domain-containing protein [Gemmatimonadales bacterium]
MASSRASAFVGRVFYAGKGESGFGAEWEAEPGIGEVWPLLGLTRGKVPVTLHLGSEVYGRFSLGDQASALISTDWHVNLMLTADFPKLRLALEAYHESSHLGDEYEDRFPRNRINWSREIVGAWAQYRTGSLTLAGNLSYAAIDAAKLGRGAVALAVDYEGKPTQSLGGRAHPVVALHVDMQEYTDWKATFSGRAGARFVDGQGRRGFGLFLTWYDGMSSQRQFFFAKSRYVGVEVRFDL